MSLSKRALWIIERNLDKDLNLGDLAAACGVSPCHLSHAFAEGVGRPVTDYIRARRLSFAAQALADGAQDILGLALNSGYGSHEAFSRAFKNFTGVTPESVRRRGTIVDLPLLAPIDMTTADERTIDAPEIRALEKQTYACLSERVDFQTTQRIPALWQRFMTIYPEIDDKADPTPVGIVWPIEDDGGFTYACAVAVEAGSTLPRGLVKMTVPARQYAVFQHPGHISTVRGSYNAIWNRALPANGWTTIDQPSFEFHNPAFDPRTGEGGIAIWLPVVRCG